MRRMTKFAAVAAAAALSIGGFTACSNSDEGGGKGTVYYLNFKPESEAAWKEIASTYQKKTGVKVKIVTAASGKYEETLKSELGKSGGPTLFNLNGPVGLKIWQKYAANLTDTDFAKKLTDKSLALKGDDGKTYGVPFALEGYGIIYNKTIMDKYFALPDAKVKSVAEIKSFDKLKEAAEIDGAGKWRRLRSVTIPMIMPSITICLFLTLANTFKMYDQNLALTSGRPGKETEMAALDIVSTMYNKVGQEGIAQAMAVVFFLIVSLIALVQLRATRSKEVDQ